MARVLWKPFTLFRLGRVPVQMHPSCLIYPIGVFAGYACYEDGLRGLLAVFLVLPLLSISLLVHEFAHVFTARHFGVGTERVVLFPFGAVAQMESLLLTPREFWIALAGPLSSLILAGIFGLVYSVMGHPFQFYSDEGRLVVGLGFAFNITLALFNLLPCFPMDGGRMLRSLLAVIVNRVLHRRPEQAFLIATRIAVRYVAWPLALGVIVLTILETHLWLHLILFPLLLLAAEIEYWLLRTSDRPQGVDEVSAEPSQTIVARPTNGADTFSVPR